MKLPFRPIRNDTPRIVFTRKPIGAKGQDTYGHFDSIDNVVRIDKKLIKKNKSDFNHTIQHEIAHYQLHDRRYGDELGLIKSLDGELRVDLLVYKRTGGPEHYTDRIGGIWAQGHDLLSSWKVSHYQKSLRVMSAINKAFRHYWDYLPKEWKSDYLKWQKMIRHERAKSLKHLRKTKNA